MPRAIVNLIKPAASTLDYGFDWSDWLEGKTIIESSWVAPAGVTVVDEDFSDIIARIWLSGGVDGQSYEITNRITTSGTPALIDQRTLKITIGD